MKYILAALLVFTCLSGNAENKFQLIKNQLSLEAALSGKACMTVVCELPQNWCHSQENLKLLGGWCANSDGDCVESICTRNSTMCDSSDELQEVIKACKGGANNCQPEKKSCVDVGCKASSNCSFYFADIAAACKGADGDCVAMGCEASSNCSFYFKDIARSCVGVDGKCVEAACNASSNCSFYFKDITKQCAISNLSNKNIKDKK